MKRNRVRRLLVLTVTCWCVAACESKRPAPQPDVATSRDVISLQTRIVTLESDVLAAQKTARAQAVTSESLRRRLVDVEARLMTPAATTASTPEKVVAASPDQSKPRRGGFTDFGESVRALPPLPLAPPERPAPSTPLTRDPDIIRRCSDKWGTDYQMVAYCQKEQQSAKDTWSQGNSAYHTNEGAFSDIRRGCTSKWGTDYQMRVYCEKEQVKAYGETRR